VSKTIAGSEGSQIPQKGSRAPWMIISAIYLIIGLAYLGDVHDATLLGIGYIAISACYYLGHRRE
jgi:hypothetical protein